VTDPAASALLARIAAAVERLAPPAPANPDWKRSWAFVAEPTGFRPVTDVSGPDLHLLQGVDAQRTRLLANTRAFAAGAMGNHALLWGARGTGKSALVKAVCREVVKASGALKLVQISADLLLAQPGLASALRASPCRVILFIDDLSLDADGPALRALKPMLEGGLEAGDGNLMVYATSNRRHLTHRDPAENAIDDLHWRDTAEERLAISDRFGLSLGFHPWDQATYLAAVRAHAEDIGLAVPDLERDALAWSVQRGARSGRTAWQFILDRAMP